MATLKRQKRFGRVASDVRVRKWNGEEMGLSSRVDGSDHEDLSMVGTGDPGAIAIEVPNAVASLFRTERRPCQVLATGGQVADANCGEHAAVG
jgi:hypothetical protein